MNQKTGKLLVSYGFLISLIITATSMVLSYLWLFSNFSIPQFLNTLFTILSICASTLVVVGFSAVFMANRKLLDLLIAVAFTATYALDLAQSFGVFNPYAAGGIAAVKAVTVLTLVAFIPYVLWFIKLIRTAPAGAISVLLSVIVSLFAPSIIAKWFTPSDEKFVILSMSISIVVCALRTLAAFLDKKA